MRLRNPACLAKCGLIVGVIGVTVFVSSPASADTITVDCSASALVAAIQTANSTPDEDTISLADGCVYTLAAAHVESGQPAQHVSATLGCR